MHISFAEVLARRELISTSDAVALVLATARAWQERDDVDESALPLPPAIFLSGTGRISFARAPSAGEGTDVRALSDLLHALVEPIGASATRAAVPGALLLLVARSRGQIDLPPPTFDEFIRTLSRFGSADTMTLALLYRRLTAV